LARAKKAAAQPASAARNAIAEKLARAGLRRDWDFVLHLPLRYEDETRVTAIADLEAGTEAQVEADVVRADVVYRGRRQLRVTVRDAGGAELVLRFLHFYPSQLKQLEVGRKVRAFGSVRGGLAGHEMVHPRVRPIGTEAALPTSLTPIYPAPEGVPQAWLRKRIARALQDVDIVEVLPGACLPPTRSPA
jgi:ATP-dependent DNA helicase RecG